VKIEVYNSGQFLTLFSVIVDNLVHHIPFFRGVGGYGNLMEFSCLSVSLVVDVDVGGLLVVNGFIGNLTECEG